METHIISSQVIDFGGIHMNEEKIIKFLLENKEIVIIKEGIEYSKYENIPLAVQKKYEEYLEKRR